MLTLLMIVLVVAALALLSDRNHAARPAADEDHLLTTWEDRLVAIEAPVEALR